MQIEAARNIYIPISKQQLFTLKCSRAPRRLGASLTRLLLRFTLASGLPSSALNVRVAHVRFPLARGRINLDQRTLIKKKKKGVDSI